jgi:hypothetical protein
MLGQHPPFVQCAADGHKKKLLEFICIHQKCPHKGLICSSCLYPAHADHVGEVVPVDSIQADPKTLQEPHITKETLVIETEVANLLNIIKDFRTAVNDTLNRYEGEVLTLAAQVSKNIKENPVEKMKNFSYRNQEERDEVMHHVSKMVKKTVANTWTYENIELGDYSNNMQRTITLMRDKIESWKKTVLTEFSLFNLEAPREILLLNKNLHRYTKIDPTATMGFYYASTYLTKATPTKALFLKGISLYEIKKFPENNPSITFEVRIFEGDCRTAVTPVFTEELQVTTGSKFIGKVGEFYFQKEAPLKANVCYTIMLISLTQRHFETYFGTDMAALTEPFVFVHDDKLAELGKLTVGDIPLTSVIPSEKSGQIAALIFSTV